MSIASGFGNHTRTSRLGHSRLPRALMSGGSSWDDIARQLGENETTPAADRHDVVMGAGGAVEIFVPGTVTTQRATLPHKRMAARPHHALSPSPQQAAATENINMQADGGSSGQRIST